MTSVIGIHCCNSRSMAVLFTTIARCSSEIKNFYNFFEHRLYGTIYCEETGLRNPMPVGVTKNSEFKGGVKPVSIKIWQIGFCRDMIASSNGRRGENMAKLLVEED